MTNEVFKSPKTLVLAAIFLIVMLGFVFKGRDVAEFFGSSDMINLGFELTIPTVSDGYSDIGVGDLFELEMIARPEGLPVTATDVGCTIAKLIQDDFIKFGEQDEGVGISASGSLLSRMDLGTGGIGELPEKLVAFKKFKLTKSGVSAFRSYDTIEDGDDKDLIAKLCLKETGQKLDDVNIAGFRPCDGVLSEECITRMLSQLTHGGQDFCNNDIRIMDSGKYEKFGNDNCGDSDNHLDEADRCHNTCPGKDRIDRFYTAGIEKFDHNQMKLGEDPYLTDDSLDRDSSIPQDNFYTSDAPEYVFVIKWDVGTKAYRVYIYKVPVGVEYGDETPENVADDINDVLSLSLGSEAKVKPFQRSEDAGWKVSSLRISRNITFTASNDILVKDFIEQSVPTEFSKIQPDCGSNSACANPTDKIKNVAWVQLGNNGDRQKIESLFGIGDIEEYGATCSAAYGDNNWVCRKIGDRRITDGEFFDIDEIYNLDNVYIYTPLGNDEYLETGRIYNVVINNWFYNHRSFASKANGWEKIEGNLASKFTSEADHKRKIKSVQDISIIITEKGRTGLSMTEPFLSAVDCCEQFGATVDGDDCIAVNADLENVVLPLTTYEKYCENPDYEKE